MMKAAVQSVPPPVPLFTTLSELDHQPLDLRDYLALLPAILLSVVLNGIFLSVLMVANPGIAQAKNKLKSITKEDVTQIEDKQEKNDKPTIDIFTPDQDAAKDIVKNNKLAMPSLDPPKDDARIGLTAPPPEKSPIGGAGAGDDSKFKGANALGAEALKGDPIFAEMGAAGSGGSMPLGGGAGLNSGGGGGSNKSGGYGQRTGDLTELAKRLGGSDESQRAVARSLFWLRTHQSPDGRWSLHRYHVHDKRCDCQSDAEKEPGHMYPDDVSATAMGVLPFLAAGHHHLGQKEESRVVAQALRFLLSQQTGIGEEDGQFKSDNPKPMYTQGLATIAICEAYGMTNDPKLRDSALRAIKYIVKSQNPNLGGWRYQPRTSSDTSVVGWQVMALKSAQMAGLPVPNSAFDGASRWLDRAQVKQNRPGGRSIIRYAYAVDINDPSSGGTTATTAAGLLSRLYLGWGPRHADMIMGCDGLLDDALPPAEFVKGKTVDIYTWYYAAQVMHHMGGEYWEKWNPRMREYLIASQEREGHKTGSWDPGVDKWGRQGGRIYTTALSALTLEVYYRHLPLYRREKLDRESNEEISRKQADADKKPIMTAPNNKK